MSKTLPYMHDNTVHTTFSFYRVSSGFFRNFDAIDFNEKLAHDKDRKKFIAPARD